MRIGVMPTAGGGVDELVSQARDLEARGFDTLWLPGVFGLDPVVAAAVLVSCSTMAWSADSSRNQPCSMLLTPARAAASIPRAACACAMTARLWRSASDTIASSSSSAMCWW
jgi:alkanesulfonate monooxygenase SsuD/methylene tetrahydromethanopterin reductase-like flavin-dependent oxidoreductase (luciferase family)